MKLKPRHVFAALLLVGQAPLLVPLVVGSLIGATIQRIALAFEQLRQLWRTVASHAGVRMHRVGWWRRWRRRPPRPGSPAWGW